MTGGFRLDLHVHTTYSPDSRLPLDAVVERLGTEGLQGFALTDHNTVAGHAALRTLADKFPQVPGSFPASRSPPTRVTSSSSGSPRSRRSIARSRRPSSGWRRTGAWPSPRTPPGIRTGSVGASRRASRYPALETVNGHNSEVANARAALIAASRTLGETGGSDAHDAAGVGRGYTVFPEGVETVDQMLEELRRRHTRSGGVSLRFGEMARLAIRTVTLRVTRGFRPI